MSAQFTSYLVTVTLLLLAAACRQKHTTAAPTTLPGCPDKCGNVSVPYPFGTKDGCYLPGFQIICDHSFHSPRAFFPYDPSSSRKPRIVTDHIYYNERPPLGFRPAGMPKNMPVNRSFLPVELTGVSVAEGKLQVHAPFCYDCKLNKTYHSHRRRVEISFPDRSPFLLSEEGTVLMGIGKHYVVAVQRHGSACEARVEPSLDKFVNGTCSGRGCCQSTLLPLYSENTVTMEMNYYDHDCIYAMFVDKSWYNFTLQDLDGDVFLRRNDARGVAVVVDFVVQANHSCPLPGQEAPKGYACASDNTKCDPAHMPFHGDTGYLCRCLQGYQGNPYVENGCQGT